MKKVAAIICAFNEEKTIENVIISISEIKNKLSTIFPKYMIPTVYIKMECLPRNTNGKIDRLLLNQMVNI